MNPIMANLMLDLHVANHDREQSKPHRNKLVETVVRRPRFSPRGRIREKTLVHHVELVDSRSTI
jgi:hypothetical protein